MKRITEGKTAVEHFFDATDEPPVAQCAEDRAVLHPFKDAEAEKQEGKQDADEAADTVIAGLEAADLHLEAACALLYEQLVGFGGKVGAEHERHAEGAEHRPQKEQKDAQGNARCADQPREQHAAIKGKAVDDRRHEGEKVAKAKPPQHEHHDKKDHRLQRVFHHAEGDEIPQGGQLQVQYIGRRYHHAHAEICFFHQRRAEGNEKDTEGIGKLRIKGFLLHVDVPPPKKKTSMPVWYRNGKSSQHSIPHPAEKVEWVQENSPPCEKPCKKVYYHQRKTAICR